MLTKNVKREYLKIMGQIMSSNEVSMKQEISVFRKYLKMKDHLLAQSTEKDKSKKVKIVKPIFDK